MGEVDFEEANTSNVDYILPATKNLTSLPNSETGESDTTDWDKNITGGTEGDDELWVNQTEWEDEFEVEHDGGGLHSTEVIVVVILIVYSFLSNITLVLATLSKVNVQAPLCSVHLLFRHLATTHLLVTSVFVPTLMRWINLSDFTYEGSWVTGDGACRTVVFLNSFGMYMTGNLTTCITLDRYMVILRPADACHVIYRAKIMLLITWLCSALCSCPEAVLYHVEVHPVATWLQKCRLSGSLGSSEAQIVYVTTQKIFSYGLPLVTTVIGYVRLHRKISRMNARTSSFS